MRNQAHRLEIPKRVAILTGDLIGSTKAGPEAVDGAMLATTQAAADIAAWGAQTQFSRFRGDGWQLMLAPPKYALRAAVAVMAKLKGAGGLETRLAIGVGPIDDPVPADLSGASGKALERSGRALDGMKRTEKLTIAGLAPARLHGIIVDLIDERMTRWTAEQAEATALYLDPLNPTLADIAKRLGISSQAVSYRLHGAGAPRLRSALDAWEADVTQGETP